MKRLALSHPTGNANVRAVLGALDSARLLDTFYTTVGVREGGLLLRALPPPLRHKADRRSYGVVDGNIVFHPFREMLRLLGRGNIDSVYVDLDRFVAEQLERGGKGVAGVYCYEDGALATFRAARELGAVRFYDLPIAYWETAQRLLREEAERLPAWEPTLVGTRDPEEKLQRKSEELALADVVFCPSRFVEDSLPRTVRESAICVRAEFGSPRISLSPLRSLNVAGAPLRVLFAGSMTQRKGLADVFAAMKLLNRPDVRLIVMGSPVAPLDFYRREFPQFDYEAPRAHREVLDLMQKCDVLVLPSIVEGRALVQQEAMACGLPLIVTANAGGEDLIDEGRTGFLVPIRAPEKIAEKIDWLAHHREALPAMREAAQRKAASYTWEKYGERISSTVRQVLGGTGAGSASEAGPASADRIQPRASQGNSPVIAEQQAA